MPPKAMVYRPSPASASAMAGIAAATAIASKASSDTSDTAATQAPSRPWLNRVPWSAGRAVPGMVAAEAKLGAE